MNWHNGVTNSYIVGFGNTEMPKLQGNIFPDIYSQSVGSYSFQSINDFVQEMKRWHTNNIIHKKADNLLLNAVVYKDNTRRTTDNAMFSTALIIDIDDGDLSPNEFHRIFSNVYPFSHFVTNSASRSAQQPNRYRAVFFVKEIMSNNCYQLMLNHIISLLKKEGYETLPLMYSTNKENHLKKLYQYNPNIKLSGIDMSKNNLSSLFYAPCQMHGQEDYAFFWNFGTSNRDANRYALNPSKIIQHSHFPEKLGKLILVDVSKVDKQSISKNIKTSKNYQKVLTMVGQLSDGNRSHLSCRIGGSIKNFDQEVKEEIYQMMLERGCDSKQIKAAKGYANKN